MRPVSSECILDSATGTGAGSSKIPWCTNRTFQVVGAVSDGTGSATCSIEASNNGQDWITLGTFTLSLATSNSTDGFTSDAAWKHIRANVTAISGTGASVSVWMGNNP